MFEQLPSNQRHISCTCVMIRIMQSICISKMGILTAQFLASAVHLLYEPVVIMTGIHSDTLTYCICCFIGRCQKHRMHCLIQCDYISLF